MASTNMLENAKKVVERAREAGATVIHAPITFVEGYNEISAHPYGILKGVVDSNAFVKGLVGRGHRRRPRAEGRRHRRRGQARARHVRQHEPRLHPAEQGDHDDGARRLPDELLRRVDDAQRLREGLSRWSRSPTASPRRRARSTTSDRVRLPDVLQPMTSEEFIAELKGAGRRLRREPRLLSRGRSRGASCTGGSWRDGSRWARGECVRRLDTAPSVSADRSREQPSLAWCHASAESAGARRWSDPLVRDASGRSEHPNVPYSITPIIRIGGFERQRNGPPRRVDRRAR